MRCRAGAFTSVRAGNWSDPGTWGGSGVPKDGDTVTLRHAVTLNQSAVVGTSGVAGTVAVTCSGPASLTVAPAVTFTLRGDFVQADCPVTLSAGSTWQFDSTHSAAPTTTRYSLHPSANAQNANKITVSGTPSAPVTIQSVAGGASGHFAVGSFDGSSQWDAQYVNFLRIGDAATDSLQHALNVAGQIFRIEHAHFDTCGGIGYRPTGASPWNAQTTFKVNDTVWTNTAAIACLGVGTQARRAPAFTWEVRGNYFDHGFSGTATDFTFTHNVFIGAGGHTSFIGGNSFADPWTLFQWNIVYNSYNVSVPILASGDFADSLILENTAYNPHMVFPVAKGPQAMQGVILQSVQPAGDGDGFLVSGNYGPKLTITRTLVLPRGGSSGLSTCSLTSVGGENLPQLILEHNTVTDGAGADHGVHYWETAPVAPGTVASYQSNLMWSPQLTAGNHFHNENAGPGGGPPPDNFASPDHITHNSIWNGTRSSWPGKSSDQSFYDLPTTGVAPGAFDVNVDPKFVDPSRRFEKWGQVVHGTDGSVNGALQVLQNGDRSVLIPEMIQWIRAGWTPTNPALKGAAADGGDIGAMSMGTVVPPSPPTPPTPPVVSAPVEEASLAQLRVHPNPWRQDRQAAPLIIFDQLPENDAVTLTIFTVSGHRVRTLKTSGSSASWDLKNDHGNLVGSGLYIYLATDVHGSRLRGKLAIAR